MTQGEFREMQSLDKEVNAFMIEISWAIERISQLSKMAEQNKERKIKDLFKLVKREEMLMLAYENIKNNRGSKTAGVDNIDKKTLEYDIGIENVIRDLALELNNKTYVPLPVRRVEISKGFGKKGTRPLGIPALKDRIVQSAIKLVLEAIYEPIFAEESHGFRPNKSCQTAITRIIPMKYDWVVEGDIKGCFDNINHGKLLDILRRRIKDEKLILLIGLFLKCGYCIGFGINGTYPKFETLNGTPQGGIVSPILANIYLNEFDNFIKTKTHNMTYDDKSNINEKHRYMSMLILYVKEIIEKGVYPKEFKFQDIETYTKVEDVKKLYSSREEVEQEIERLTEQRSQHNWKSKEYKKVSKKLDRFKSILKKDEYPVKVLMDKNKIQYNIITFRNKREAVLKLKEFQKIYKHIPYINKDVKRTDTSVHYVRYADDFVILLGNQSKQMAQNIKSEISEWFSSQLALELSKEKTKITHCLEGFEFLGYRIRKVKRNDQKDGNFGYKQFSLVEVPRERLALFKQKTKSVMEGYHNSDLVDLIVRLNSMISGWSNYYRICNNWNLYKGYYDTWLTHELQHWIGRKKKCSIKKVMVNNYARSIQMRDFTPKARFYASVENKRVYNVWCKDYTYERPINVAQKIMKGIQKTYTWYYSPINESEIGKTWGMLNSGHSMETTILTHIKANNKCERCGKAKDKLIVHHTRMIKRNKKKTHIARFDSYKNNRTELLCEDCHKSAHPNYRTSR